MMGKRVADAGATPQVIFSSPAVRAITTAQFFAERLNLLPESIRTKSVIYEATLRTLQDMVALLDRDVESVMIIGHNPAISRLVNHFTGEPMDNMPPAACNSRPTPGRRSK
jgi:phosphohistidine phosphatase